MLGALRMVFGVGELTGMRVCAAQDRVVLGLKAGSRV